MRGLAHGLRGALFSSVPPVQKGSIMVRRHARHAEPGKHLLPNLWETDSRAAGGVSSRCSGSRGGMKCGAEGRGVQVVSGPTLVLISEPVEEAHLRGLPVLPNERPGAAWNVV